MFIKKKIYKTACKQTWSVAKPGVATDYAGHTGFFWQESVLLFHSRPKASTNVQPDLVFQRLTWLRPSRPFCSSEIRKYRPSSSYHAVPAGRRNKMLERTLATLNASSPTMSHALEKTKAARIGVICKSASSKLSASRLHGYSVSIYTETTKLRVLATKGAGPSCTSLGLPFTSSGIECNLVLRMASRSSYNMSQQFYPFLFQDLFQDQALGNANHEHICSIMQ